MTSSKRAMVVVLGDLARSPRMQYHCTSLAKSEYDVTVIANGDGIRGDKACEALESNKNIKQLLMSDTVDFKKFLPSTLAYIIKPIWQTLLLAVQLFLAPLPHVIIVQNPPSIPTLPIIYLYSRLIGSKLIIDWHNYGYTILSLNLRADHAFVRLSKFIEFFFGRLADAGFCVSEAMQRDLKKSHNITYPVHVLYDKPPAHFKPLSIRMKHEFFLSIKNEIPCFAGHSKDLQRSKIAPTNHQDQETRFTMTHQEHPYHVIQKPGRPAIVLSSTSWTEDEDFDVLLDALKLYDSEVGSSSSSSSTQNELPKLVCVITGKGPLKAHYEAKIAAMKLKNIEIVLPWLASEDYPKMVGSCDLGISLHSSSSKVDLPMKVVDLFGCGIPVLAYRDSGYEAIDELVKEDCYGLTFRNSQELFLQLTRLLKDFYSEERLTNNPDEKFELSPFERYRKNIVRHFLKSRWESNWKQVAKPVFDELSSLSQARKSSATSKKIQSKSR